VTGLSPTPLFQTRRYNGAGFEESGQNRTRSDPAELTGIARAKRNAGAGADWLCNSRGLPEMQNGRAD